jgi:glycosyltransferase involved in cell wall biosynthesis
MDQLAVQAASQGTVLQEGVAKRVLFVNRSYWPDCEATGQLLTELCEDLASTFDVSVLVGQPNHVAEEDQVYASAGVQWRNDVEIYRVRHSRFPKRSIVGKACNMVSFMLAATWQSFFIPKHQVVVVETDPFLLALLGGMLKRWRGSDLVIYMQDVYPDVAEAIGKVNNPWVTSTTRWLLMRAYARADRIVVLGEDMRRRLIRNGVPAAKLVCVPNWIDTENVVPMKTHNDFRRQHGLEGKFVIMHSGNMGLTQQLHQVMEVADRLRDREQVVFLLVGHGASRPALEQEVRDRKLTNVRFLPYQSRENLALSLSAADLHIVSMHPNISGCLVPSKIYGIMASATPVLAVVPDDTDVHALVQQERIGMTVLPDDLDTLEATIVRCLDGQLDLAEMGLRAREVVESRFDRRHSAAAFGELLDEFMHRKPATTPHSPLRKKTEYAVPTRERREGKERREGLGEERREGLGNTPAIEHWQDI